MPAGAAELAELLRAELARPAPEPAARLAAAIRARTGAATAAVVFYGSCLRRGTTEGVLDFYVLVDDYAAALGPGWLARASGWLPPTVIYTECPGADGATLRAKYAVLSLADFQRGAGPDGWRTGIWARFCQPVALAWVRDDATREGVLAGCAQAVETAVTRIAPLLDGPATPAEFWQRAFAETYRREMRTESPESIAALYASVPERYDRALREALRTLEARGVLRAKWSGDRFALDLGAEARAAAQRRWERRRTPTKVVYLGQLLKTAFTFGDWLPYALWKVERHTGGGKIETTERQRRHPLVFGWPILVRLIRERRLR